jgi:PAS domain S-box-containing protein
MRAEELGTELAEQLSKAQARIAELETANALLRAEHQLHADMHRQALVLEQVHDAIITTDLAGTITNWNHGAEKMFGYEAHEVVGHNVALLYFEEDREQVHAGLLQPPMREHEREIELRQRRRSGEESISGFL